MGNNNTSLENVEYFTKHRHRQKRPFVRLLFDRDDAVHSGRLNLFIFLLIV